MTDLIWTPIKIRLGQIIPWSDNPRMSTKAQAQRLIKSERELGQIQTLAVSPFEDGKVYLYDGHQRCAAWMTVKDASYEVTALQSNRMLTEDERKKVSILLHTATGSWSWEALSSWSAADLQEWGMDEDTLKGWNNDANNLKEMLNAGQAEEVDAEPQIDRAAELAEKWQTSTGQLWKLGEHRLLIGDCTVRENVEKLMGGEMATLAFTDPPYLFETEGGWFSGKRPKVMKGIKDGKLNEFNPIPFLEILQSIFQDGYHSSFIFCNKDLIYFYLKYAFDNKLSSNILVWKKKSVVPFGDSHFPDVEYLIFLRKSAKWINGTNLNRSRVLEYDQDFLQQEDHPTPKPVPLVQNQLGLTTDTNDIVVDFFAGSGTTIIAAHNLNRRCYAMEISEKYGAVILERFFTATGITPELIENG